MSDSNKMFIVKRDGRKEKVSFDKIIFRLQNLSKGNLDAKHLLFAWGAGLAVGITVGQEATRATYFSKNDGD